MLSLPGHGKAVVDGLIATDKRYLKRKMSMLVSTPEENNSINRMSAALCYKADESADESKK
jgi:hypothetical protein